MNNLPQSPVQTVRVWDLPLRIFHWALSLTISGLFITVKVGGAALQWHFYFGYLALTLLMFRVLWGFFGNHYARFSSFPPNPAAAWRTLRGTLNTGLGHNPMGALSVYALLTALSFQAISGLFSNDDIANEGPLVVKISKEFSDQITQLHKFNENIIISLVLLHLAAITFYHFKKKEPLIQAMITGNKPNISETPSNLVGIDTASIRWRGFGLFIVCAITVACVVNFNLS